MITYQREMITYLNNDNISKKIDNMSQKNNNM